MRRIYFLCRECGLGEAPADAAVGLIGNISLLARELIAWAGRSSAFQGVAGSLKKFFGWKIGASTARAVCEAEGRALAEWREGCDRFAATPVDAEDCTRTQRSVGPASEAAAAEVGASASLAAEAETHVEAAAAAPPALHPDRLRRFLEAKGGLEFLTDGAMVRTQDGWKEIRLAVWLKRPVGVPAQVWDWSCRILPRPTAAATLIDFAPADEFGPRWRPWSARLGVADFADLTVLADGAEWIWRQAVLNLPGASGCLDVYHAVEHLADAARSLFGDPAESGAAAAWTDVGRRWLLLDGWNGVCRWVAGVRNECSQSSKSVEETDKALTYFSKHKTRLNYRERLRRGLSIGSGAVEGAVKQIVTRRLKQTGAAWRPENAVAMATLASTLLADDWDDYWANRSCLAVAA